MIARIRRTSVKAGTSMPFPPPKPRIVLVDDDPDRIEFFGRWLQATEFVLVTARPGG